MLFRRYVRSSILGWAAWGSLFSIKNGKKIMKNIKYISAVLAGLTIVASSSANLFLNGGFEADENKEVPSSWSVFSGATAKVKDGSIEGQTLDGISPLEGDKVVQLQDTTNPRTAGISQVFTVPVTGDYIMSGFLCPRKSPYGSTNYTFQILNSLSSVVAPTTQLDPVLVFGEFGEISRTYSALPAGQYTVEFINWSDASTLLQSSIDDFSFNSNAGSSVVGGVGEVLYEIVNDGTEIELSWFGEYGGTYVLKETDSLIGDGWTSVTNIAGANSVISFIKNLEAPSAFYRVELAE